MGAGSFRMRQIRDAVARMRSEGAAAPATAGPRRPRRQQPRDAAAEAAAAAGAPRGP